MKEPREFWASLLHPERPDLTYSDFASRALGLCLANFGMDFEFYSVCRAICSVHFKVSYTPSMVRYLKILGIVIYCSNI